VRTPRHRGSCGGDRNGKWGLTRHVLYYSSADYGRSDTHLGRGMRPPQTVNSFVVVSPNQMGGLLLLGDAASGDTHCKYLLYSSRGNRYGRLRTGVRANSAGTEMGVGLEFIPSGGRLGTGVSRVWVITLNPINPTYTYK